MIEYIVNSYLQAIETAAPTEVPRRSANVTGPTSHGPFSGTPTVSGAVQANTTLAQMIAPGPPNPTATYYNPNGSLLNPAPAPYTPNGMSIYCKT